jgi:hypothetical protein
MAKRVLLTGAPPRASATTLQLVAAATRSPRRRRRRRAPLPTTTATCPTRRRSTPSSPSRGPRRAGNIAGVAGSMGAELVLRVNVYGCATDAPLARARSPTAADRQHRLSGRHGLGSPRTATNWTRPLTSRPASTWPRPTTGAVPPTCCPRSGRSPTRRRWRPPADRTSAPTASAPARSSPRCSPFRAGRRRRADGVDERVGRAAQPEDQPRSCAGWPSASAAGRRRRPAGGRWPAGRHGHRLGRQSPRRRRSPGAPGAEHAVPGPLGLPDEVTDALRWPGCSTTPSTPTRQSNRTDRDRRAAASARAQRNWRAACPPTSGGSTAGRAGVRKRACSPQGRRQLGGAGRAQRRGGRWLGRWRRSCRATCPACWPTTPAPTCSCSSGSIRPPTWSGRDELLEGRSRPPGGRDAGSHSGRDPRRHRSRFGRSPPASTTPSSSPPSASTPTWRPPGPIPTWRPNCTPAARRSSRTGEFCARRRAPRTSCRADRPDPTRRRRVRHARRRRFDLAFCINHLLLEVPTARRRPAPTSTVRPGRCRLHHQRELEPPDLLEARTSLLVPALALAPHRRDQPGRVLDEPPRWGPQPGAGTGGLAAGPPRRAGRAVALGDRLVVDLRSAGPRPVT